MGLYKAVSNAPKAGLVGLMGYSVGVVNDEVGEILPSLIPNTLSSNFDRLKALATIIIISIIAATLLPVVTKMVK